MASQAFAGVPQTCKTVWEEKCWDEPRETCTTVQKPYTVTVHDTACTTHYDEKCHTEYETKVCNYSFRHNNLFDIVVESRVF